MRLLKQLILYFLLNHYSPFEHWSIINVGVVWLFEDVSEWCARRERRLWRGKTWCERSFPYYYHEPRFLKQNFTFFSLWITINFVCTPYFFNFLATIKADILFRYLHTRSRRWSQLDSSESGSAMVTRLCLGGMHNLSASLTGCFLKDLANGRNFNILMISVFKTYPKSFFSRLGQF